MKYIKATKLNMSQIFKEDGTVIPVTWVEMVENKEVEEGTLVTVKGKSKGKGFSGVIKRHNFSRQPKTHGQSDRERAPGSIGATTGVARVLKGKKMAGREGNKKITLKNKEVVKVDSKKVAISGPVPGSYGADLKIVLEK